MTKFQVFGRLVAMLVATTISLAAEDPKAAIQQKIQSEFAVTQATAAEDDIVTAGAILVVKKGNIMMSPTSSTNMFQNTYKDGKISQNSLGSANKFWDHARKLPGMGGSAGTSSRTYVPGEKMWLTKIDVRDDGLVLNLLTDAISDVRYKASLKFPWPKGTIPPADQVEKEVADVFSVQPADNSNGNQQPTAQGSQPAAPVPQPPAVAPAKPAEAVPAPITPPPPPTDAPTQTISMGQTTDQVVGILGQPTKIIKLGPKQIYVYKDMKITFKEGKVSDVQ